MAAKLHPKVLLPALFRVREEILIEVLAKGGEDRGQRRLRIILDHAGTVLRRDLRRDLPELLFFPRKVYSPIESRMRENSQEKWKR